MSKKKQMPPEETQEEVQAPEEDGAVDAQEAVEVSLEELQSQLEAAQKQMDAADKQQKAAEQLQEAAKAIQNANKGVGDSAKELGRAVGEMLANSLPKRSRRGSKKEASEIFDNAGMTLKGMDATIGEKASYGSQLDILHKDLQTIMKNTYLVR